MTKKQFAKLWKKVRRYADSEVSRSWAGFTCSNKKEHQEVEDENKAARKDLIKHLKELANGSQTSNS